MTSVPLAFSIHQFISSVGADAGFASLIGLALLVLLYFAHARETSNLRQQVSDAAERTALLEARVLELTRQLGHTQSHTLPPVAPPARFQTRVATAAGSVPGRGASAASALAGQPPADPAPAGGGPRGMPFAPAGVGAPALAAATRVVPAAGEQDNNGAVREVRPATLPAPPVPGPAGAPERVDHEPLVTARGDQHPAPVAVPGAMGTVTAYRGTGSAGTVLAPPGSAPAPPGSAPAPPGSVPAAAGSAPAPPGAISAPESRRQGSSPATVAGAANGSRQRQPPPPAPAPGGTMPPRRRVVDVEGARGGLLVEPERDPSRARRVVLSVLGLLAVAAIGAVLFIVLHNTSNPQATSANQAAAHSSASRRGAARARGAFNPASVTVAVLNGTTINELAHRVANVLIARGFKHGAIVTAVNQTQTATTVGYTAGHRSQALQVAKALKLGTGAVIPVDPSTLAVACPQSTSSCSATVVVTVGTDLSSI